MFEFELFLFIAIPLITFIVMLTAYFMYYSRIKDARKYHKEINEKALSILKEVKFDNSKTFYLNDHVSYALTYEFKQQIFADVTKNALCFIDYENGNITVVGFDEILNYEIYENGSTTTSGVGFGGICAALFSTETTGLCKELKLIIRLKRYDVPQITYTIIENTYLNIGANKTSTLYRQCISSLQEIVSFLQVIIDNNSKKH